jgi:hypothetical protein
MGKRELVLIAVFVALGVAIYQFTAPPSPPGSGDTSVGGILRNIRRGMQGARETATADSTVTAAVAPAVETLRVNFARVSDVTIAGEERDDVKAEIHVTARGFDQAEAKSNADSVKVRIETTADAIVVSQDLAASVTIGRRTPPPQFSVTVHVPERLSMRMESHFGRLVVTNLAAAEIMGARGETRIADIAGRLQITHSGGSIDITSAGALKLSARNSRGTVKKVSGPVTLEATGGDLTLSEITGPLELDCRNTDLRLEDIAQLTSLRAMMTGGELRVDGLRAESRIDGHNTDIDVKLAASAPVTIYNLGEIVVTAPPTGYTLDAVASEGRITVDDGSVQVTDGTDSRAEGKVRGGGAALTLRSTRGRIEIRKAGVK